MDGRRLLIIATLLLMGSAASADIPGGPSGTLRSGYLAVMGWGVFVLCAFLIGVLMREKPWGEVSGIAMLMIVWGVFGFCCVDFLYGLLFFVGGAVSLGIGLLVSRRMRAASGGDKLAPIVRNGLIIFFVILGFVAQFAIFTFSSGYSGPARMTATGFSKIKPQYGGTWIGRDGNGSLMFTNGVGTTIYVEEVGISAFAGGRECVIGADSIRPSNAIRAGENMAITDLPAECTQTGNPGDIWQIRVRIQYNYSVGGIAGYRNDTGTMRGPRE